MTKQEKATIMIKIGSTHEGLLLLEKSVNDKGSYEMVKRLQKLNAEIEEILMKDHDQKTKPETKY